MAASDIFSTHLEIMLEATNLGYWFYTETFYALETLIPNDPTDFATYQARINASTLLTTEEKAEAIAATNFYNDEPVRYLRKFLPPYYGNTRELVRTFALLISGYYVDTPTHPNIEAIYDLYVSSEDYLMSDEDEYKIPENLNRLLAAAEAELIVEIDAVNANE